MAEPARQGLTAKVLSGASWSAFSRLGAQALSLVSAAVVARIVPPAAYGLMGMAQLAVGFAALFQDIGTAAAVIQRREVDQRFLSTIWWANIALGCATSSACWLLAPVAALFYHEPAVVPLLRAIAWSFVLNAASAVHNALLCRRLQFRHLVIAELTGGTAGLLTAISLAKAGAGVWALVGGSLTNTAVNSALQFTLARWAPSALFSWSDLKSISHFGLHLSGFNFVNYFARNADNALIGRYLGAGPLGYYQIAYYLMLYPVQSISQTLGRVLFPAFTKMQGDHERFRNAYLRACAAIAALTFPMMTGLAILAEEFVMVVLGPKWRPIIPLVRILAPVGALQSVVTITGQIYLVTGRTDLMFRWGILSSAIFVSAFLAGLHWGVEGVAIAYAIAFVLLLVPAFALAVRLIELPLCQLWRALRSSVWCSFLMALLVLAVQTALARLLGKDAVFLRLVTCTLAGAGFYFSAIAYLRPPVFREMDHFTYFLFPPNRSETAIAQLATPDARAPLRENLKTGQ